MLTEIFLQVVRVYVLEVGIRIAVFDFDSILEIQPPNLEFLGEWKKSRM